MRRALTAASDFGASTPTGRCWSPRLKALTGLGSTPEHVKTLPPEAVIKTPQDREAVEDLIKELEALRRRCQEQTRSRVTPMGSEMSRASSEDRIAS